MPARHEKGLIDSGVHGGDTAWQAADPSVCSPTTQNSWLGAVRSYTRTWTSSSTEGLSLPCGSGVPVDAFMFFISAWRALPLCDMFLSRKPCQL